MLACLDATEQAYWRRLRHPARRHQFLCGRALLRSVVAPVLGCGADQISIIRGHHGKPVLQSPVAGWAVPHFNLAHSGDWLLLALSPDDTLGVDIEQVDARRDCVRLVQRCFSAVERQAFARNADPVAAFHRCWVRKEALLKALGRGLGFGLANFSVSTAADPGPVKVRFHCPGIDGDWFHHDVPSPPGYCSALAIANRVPLLCRREWSPV